MAKIKIKKEYLILVIIILLGAFIRFDGILREYPVQYHSDTWLTVDNALKFADSDFNYNRPFAWPAATLIHIWGIAFSVIQIFMPISKYFAIRSIEIGNALVGTLTIVMLYLLGRKMYSSRAALIASLFFSVMMFHAQVSRYETAYSWAIFIMVAVMYFSYEFFSKKEGKGAESGISYQGFQTVKGKFRLNRDLAIIGALIGFGFATQYNSLIMLVPLFLFMCFKYDFFVKIFRKKKIDNASLRGFFKSGIVLLIAALIVFSIFAPHIVFNLSGWIKGVQHDASRRQGFVGLKATGGMGLLAMEGRIFTDLSWGFGFSLMIACVLALLYILYRRRKEDIAMAALIIVYFLFMERYPLFLTRYTTLMMPFLALSLGTFSDDILLKFRLNWQKAAIYFVLFLIFAYSFFYSMAYVSIMKDDDVRYTAGQWFMENVPSGSSIAFGPGTNPWMTPVIDYSKYPMTQNPDYIIIIKSAYYTIMKYAENPGVYRASDWAGEFPSQEEIGFYDYLLNERGDYKLVYSVSNTPHFLWFKVDDSNSPDIHMWSMTHPDIKIYKRTVQESPEQDPEQVENEESSEESI